MDSEWFKISGVINFFIKINKMEDSLQNNIINNTFPKVPFQRPKLNLQQESDLPHQRRWEQDNGDFTKILDYPLNENSQVIELGGYIGEWTEKIVKKFNPKLLIIEPVPKFVMVLEEKFKDFENVIIDNSAISSSNKVINLHVLDSSTSESIKVSRNIINVNAYDIEHFIKKYNLTKIDLIQVNIECEEYPLLLHWITTDILNNVKFIQIQFHTFCDDYQKKYDIISEGLKNLGFEIRYRYDFVWESWENKNFNK
jgi:FkbM family methyltransferase